MFYDKKWVKVVGLALGLPSTIFGSALVIHELVKSQVISKGVGIIILLAILGQIFYLMIYYAYKNKD